MEGQITRDGGMDRISCRDVSRQPFRLS